MNFLKLFVLWCGIVVSFSSVAEIIEMTPGTLTKEHYLAIIKRDHMVRASKGILPPHKKELYDILNAIENETVAQRWDRMLLWFEEKMREEPDLTESLLASRAEAHLVVGEWQKGYEDARKLCEEMNSQDPNHWALYTISVKALHKKETFSCGRKVVFLKFPEIEQEYQKGIKARDNGNYEEARTHFLKCHEMTVKTLDKTVDETTITDDKKTCVMRGNNIFFIDVAFIDYRLGKFKDMVDNMNQFSGWDHPDQLKTLMTMLYKYKGEIGNFLSTMEKLIEKDSLPIQYAWRALFYAFNDGGSKLPYHECQQRARRDLETALKPDPQDLDVLTVCAGVYFYLDDFEKCLATCDILEKNQFENQTWCFWKAMALLYQGKNEAAVEPLKTYIQYCKTCPTESNFNVSMGQTMLAICYAKLNQFEKAEQELQKLDPSFPQEDRLMVEMLLSRAQKKKFSREAEQYLKDLNDLFAQMPDLSTELNPDPVALKKFNDQLAQRPELFINLLSAFLSIEQQFAESNSIVVVYLVSSRKTSNILRFTPEMDYLSDKAIRYALHLDVPPADPSSPVFYLETNGNEWNVLLDVLLR